MGGWVDEWVEGTEDEEPSSAIDDRPTHACMHAYLGVGRGQEQAEKKEEAGEEEQRQGSSCMWHGHVSVCLCVSVCGGWRISERRMVGGWVGGWGRGKQGSAATAAATSPGAARRAHRPWGCGGAVGPSRLWWGGREGASQGGLSSFFVPSLLAKKPGRRGMDG